MIRNDHSVTKWHAGHSLGEEVLVCNVNPRSSTTAEHVLDLADTVFALCPRGNNPETFRFYEALEAGAIPVLVGTEEENNFLEVDYFKNYPGPVLGSWDELRGYIHDMYKPSMMDEIDGLQKTIMDWYKNFMQEVRADLGSTLDGLMASRVHHTS